MIESHHPLDNKLLLGRYRVVRLLGEGGMGTVHLARVEGAEGFTRPVVVKRMKREIRSTDEGNKLFIREAKILSKMQHPAIVGISDFGIEDGAHIMVLEYVHGYPLSAWLDYREALREPLPVDVCLFIVRRILDALHYAHHFDTEEGQEIEIVHRDIAPDNVLMSNRGYVHLLDFGVASMKGPQAEASTQAGAFRGKLGYAAPETVQGHAATPRSDQYSAGVVLLELLTHEMPFLADSMGETVVRMVSVVPDPPSAKRDDVPSGLDEAVARSLEKSPEARFESALDFSRALRKLQQADDEDVTQQIKELVRKDFEVLPGKLDLEDLKARDAALAQIFSTPPEAPKPTAGTIVTPGGVPMPGLVPAQALEATQLEPPSAMMVAAPAPAPAQSQVKGLLWGLLVVGGFIALGLGAAVAFLARGGGTSEVVVVGGERDDSRAAAPDAPDEASPEATGAHHDEPGPPAPGAESNLASNAPEANAEGTVEGAAAPTSAAPAPKRTRASAGAKRTSTSTPSGAGLQKQLARAVQRKSPAFQQCFTKHVDGGGKTSRATLHFSVAHEGGPAQVTVEPKALAGTPLGGCLSQAAGRVQFPKLQKDVAFRLPVRARVARIEGSK